MSTLKVPVDLDDHSLGNAKADIILVEYGDYQCPHCKLAHPLVKRLLKDKGNELLFVFRNFPLREVHQYAFTSAMAAEAAGKQGKFWEMNDMIFEHQEKLNTDYLFSLGEILGLDQIQFSKDLKSKKIRDKIESDFESGIRSGVNRTPTFFLNDFPIVTYNETYESLSDAVQLEIEIKQH